MLTNNNDKNNKRGRVASIWLGYTKLWISCVSIRVTLQRFSLIVSVVGVSSLYSNLRCWYLISWGRQSCFSSSGRLCGESSHEFLYQCSKEEKQHQRRRWRPNNQTKTLTKVSQWCREKWSATVTGFTIDALSEKFSINLKTQCTMYLQFDMLFCIWMMNKYKFI